MQLLNRADGSLIGFSGVMPSGVQNMSSFLCGIAIHHTTTLQPLQKNRDTEQDFTPSVHSTGADVTLSVKTGATALEKHRILLTFDFYLW
jgi:hypothetical protein